MISRACAAQQQLYNPFPIHVMEKAKGIWKQYTPSKKSSMIKEHVLLLPKHIKTYKCSCRPFSIHPLQPIDFTKCMSSRNSHIIENIFVASAAWRAVAIFSNIHCYAPRRRNVLVCFAAVREKTLLLWCMQIFTTTYFIAELEMRWKQESNHIRNWWWA